MVDLEGGKCNSEDKFRKIEATNSRNVDLTQARNGRARSETK